MASEPWPELMEPSNGGSSSKAPEWTLRTESELHVERLEAKLDSIKKKKDRSPKFNGTLAAQHTEQLDPDAEEIQSGQEEADEGLWLLWNNKRPDLGQGPGRDYISTSDPFGTTTDASDIRSSSSDEGEEDIEDRLEQAKARAKQAEVYYAKSYRSCCCIIS
ncbi:hypothetical protein BGZ93_009728 [Podila epicladia]|nr:hypothetical protein BGZ92_009411 [Podila epicladia]KAG0089678.1 hypothetical protein BGZ93_009728 [Podila epicladia]